jgi:flagellar protein FliL
VSDDKKTEAPKAPKKKGVIGKMMPVLVGLVLGAGGVGGGLYAVKPEAFKAEQAKGKKAEAAHDEGDSEKESKYFALSQPFTSNLKDSQQFVQLSISLGTYKDEAFVETLKTHEMALRSAALLTIADQTYDQVATSQGKTALAATLKEVLNKALKDRGAAPGIDTVYFTGFVVQ